MIRQTTRAIGLPASAAAARLVDRIEAANMSEKSLREKYGGKLPKAINRAIRAEIPGGGDALDKLTQLAGAARQSHWKDKAGRHTAEATAYYRHQREVIEPMDAQIRKKYGISATAVTR